MVKPKVPKKKPKLGRPKVRPGGRYPIVGIRVSPEEIADIDAIAQEESVKRSEMVRRLLTIGKRAWQKGDGRALENP